MATYAARESIAFTSTDGMPRFFGTGDLCDDSDPDFKGREHLFQPVEEAAAVAHNRRGMHPNRAMETATAAPGEVRHMTPPVPESIPTKPPVAPNKPGPGARPTGK
jgi:hypothetical protein